MKRTLSERDGVYASRGQDQSPHQLGEGKALFRRRPEEDEEAERLQALRATRQKRTKPSDWINMTFHQYRLMNVIGAGTFGEVYKGERLADDKLVALKCIKQDNDNKGFPVTAIREMRILRQMRHKNIVDLIEVIVDGNPTGGRLSTVALVFEYLDHDLSGLLDTPEAATQITPALAKSFMLQLIDGVAYMHGKNIIHRDLKGANLLISNNGYLKIADWGLARRLYEMQERYTTKVITLWYRPPELLLKAALYGPSVDMWSVGCIVAELLTRSAVFPGKNEMDQLKLIFDTVGTPTSKTWPGWTELPEADYWREVVRENPRPNRIRAKFTQYGSDEVLDLLMGLLALDPRRRLNAKQAFGHVYFKSKPLPTEPGSVMLNLHSCHEFEAKKRNKEIKKVPRGSHQGMPSAPQSRDNQRTRVTSNPKPSTKVAPNSASKIQQQPQRGVKPSPPALPGIPQRPKQQLAQSGAMALGAPPSTIASGNLSGNPHRTLHLGGSVP